MSTDKLARLTKYADDLKNRLSSPVPPKHLGAEKEFAQFLNRELDATTKKIESLKLEGGKSK